MNTMAYRDVLSERRRQDLRWGGPDHDDQHTPEEWLEFLSSQWNDAWGALNGERDLLEFRRRMIRIAALAVAAADAHDRWASEQSA
jgi:hypothetical protein